jgi:hypothetical protein
VLREAGRLDRRKGCHFLAGCLGLDGLIPGFDEVHDGTDLGIGEGSTVSEAERRHAESGLTIVDDLKDGVTRSGQQEVVSVDRIGEVAFAIGDLSALAFLTVALGTVLGIQRFARRDSILKRAPNHYGFSLWRRGEDRLDGQEDDT